ncbi:MAG: AAA family ATPase [Armatimonadetes bacterium]|nr:AAA family ATPase [Armatimonadota bacterium]
MLSQQAFCGRQAEIEQIDRWLLRAASGQGGVFLLLGEPGVGKTTLMRQCLVEAEKHGLLAFDAWCRGADWEPPWYPALALLEQIEREFQDHPQIASFAQALQSWTEAPQRSGWHFAHQLGRQLRTFARVRPFVMLIDDAHQASDALLNMIRGWLPLVRHEPLGIMLCARSTHRNDSLHDLLQETVQYGLGEYLRLANFSLEETESYLSTVGATVSAEEAHRLSLGNPLFLAEMARGAEVNGEAGPESVRSLVARRFESLQPAAQELLRWGACFEGEFNLSHINLLMGAKPNSKAIASAIETGWTDRQDETLRWTHPLVRETIYKAMPPADRARRHQAIAENAEQFALSREAALVHWTKSPPSETAFDALYSAILSIPYRSDSRFQLSLIEAALNASEKADRPAERLKLLTMRPHFMFVLPDGMMRAIEATRQAIAEAERIPDLDENLALQAQLHCALAGQMAETGSAAHGQQNLEKFLLAHDLDDERRFIVEATLAHCAAARGDIRSALAAHKRIWPLATSGSAVARDWYGVFESTVRYALALGDEDFAQEALDFAFDLLSERPESTGLQEFWHSIQAELAWFSGQAAALQYHARALMEVSRARSGENGQYTKRDWWFLSLLYRDAAQALQLLPPMLAEARTAGARQRECHLLYFQALAMRESGRLEDALNAANESLRLAKQLDNRLMAARNLLLRGELLIESGLFGDASLSVLEAESAATELQLPELQCQWLRASAHLAIAKGEDAVSLAERAATVADEWGSALYRGLSRLTLSAALDVDGNETSKSTLEEADRWLSAYGRPRAQKALLGDGAKDGLELHIALLGSGAISLAGRKMERDHWSSPRARALFSHLALANGQPIHADSLLEQHWPHLPPDSAKVNLQTTVSAARRSLKKAFGERAGEWIRYEQGLYRLAPNVPWFTDAQRLEQAIQAAMTIAPPHEQAEALRAALDPTPGELLPEFAHEPWCAGEAARANRQIQEGLIALAQNYLQSGRYGDAVNMAEHALERDDCDEQACRLAMQALTAMGRRADAIALYHRTSDALERSLDASPSPSTQKLLQEAMNG